MRINKNAKPKQAVSSAKSDTNNTWVTRAKKREEKKTSQSQHQSESAFGDPQPPNNTLALEGSDHEMDESSEASENSEVRVQSSSISSK